jgi:ribose transport system ATP-binding protein
MRLAGRRFAPRDPLDARRAGVAMIYQELSLAPHLSVMENIVLGVEPVRRGIVVRDRMRQTATAALEQLGHSDIPPDAIVGDLQPAAQQLVEIARALAVGCRVLVLDEPTSSLGHADVRTLFDLLGRLKARGLAIVYISHFIEEVKAIADRFTVLRDGRNAGGGITAEASGEAIVSLMVGRGLEDLYRRGARTAGDVLVRVEDLTPGSEPLALRRGEVVGIAGLVGAGRTRLARAIAGADRVARGRIVVRGTPIAVRSPADAVRARIGFLPEDRKQQGLVLGLSVENNVALSHLPRLSRLGVIDRGRERAEAEEAITRLRIRTPGPAQPVVHLSGGNQQKVVLAKWLAAQAEIFIFDEPTRGIDVAARQDIYTLMNGLVEQGAGIIMISSDAGEVLGMSDRLLVMRGGAIQAELMAADASEASVIQAAFGIAS